MTLVKTSILSFIATAIKMLAALTINKAVSVYIGPQGLALVGQFHNFIQIVSVAAQGAINNGVTKYVAEYGKGSERVPIIFGTASKISLVSSLLTGSGIIIFSNYASDLILNSLDYSYIFIILGATIFLFSINNLLLSFLNGLKEIKTWVIINIIQSIYSLIFTTLLIVYFGLDGALIALATNQSVVFFIVLWLLRKHEVINLKSFFCVFNKSEAKKLAVFGLMTLTTAVTVPISHVIIRNFIGENLSWQEAGYWQAMWYISTMYLMVITTTLSVYYLPRLSEILDIAELNKELIKGYMFIMPIVIIMSFIMFIMKDFVIFVLFTEEFNSVKELFFWQLVGDVVKIASWLLSFLMIAKSMTKVFVYSEIFFSATFVGFSIYLTSCFGIVGMSYAFAINYFFYFCYVFFVYRKYILNESSKGL